MGTIDGYHLLSMLEHVIRLYVLYGIGKRLRVFYPCASVNKIVQLRISQGESNEKSCQECLSIMSY